jgi:hypothetical protein
MESGTVEDIFLVLIMYALKNNIVILFSICSR